MSDFVKICWRCSLESSRMDRRAHFRNFANSPQITHWLTVWRFQLFVPGKLGLRGFKVLTAVLLKIQVCWDVTVCHRVNSSRRFELSYCFHLQGHHCLTPKKKNSITFLRNVGKYLCSCTSNIPEDLNLLRCLHTPGQPGHCRCLFRRCFNCVTFVWAYTKPGRG